MTKIPVCDSSGTWRGGLFKTDSICPSNTDSWPGPPNREFDERLYFLRSSSWFLVQRVIGTPEPEDLGDERYDPSSRAIRLTADEAAAWFARSNFEAPLELIEASRTVRAIGDQSAPRLSRAGATARSRVGALIATGVLADPTPPEVCQAIIDLLVGGGFLELTGECVEISDRRGAIESPDVVASAMLWRTMLTACREDEVLAFLRPLMRDLRSGSKGRTTVAPQEFKDLGSKLASRRESLLARAVARDAGAAELVLNYVAGRFAKLSVEKSLPARPRLDKKKGTQAAHAKALRLYEYAKETEPSLQSFKEVFAWLKNRPDLADELHGGGAKWTWETFRRYVNEARRKRDGGRIRPRAEDIRSAVGRNE